MTPHELITRIQAFTDNIDQESAVNRPRRRRILGDLQEVFDNVWNHRPWQFTVGVNDITVLAGDNFALLPPAFASLPKYGGVYVGGQPLRNLADRTLNHIHQGYVSASNVGFTISGHSLANSRGLINFDVDGPLTATMYYKRKPPRLADRPWPGYPGLTEGAAGSPNGTYFYSCTWVTSDGSEHEAIFPASTITVNNKKVEIVLPDPGPVGEHNIVYTNIYRTVAGGAVYYLLATLPFINLTYSDNIADASLVTGTPFVAYNQLAQIPEQYHSTVLLPGVRAMRKQSQGDTRDFEKEYQRGLAEMVLNERLFQSEVQQMPKWAPVRNY